MAREALPLRRLHQAISSLRRPWLLWPIVIATVLRVLFVTVQLRLKVFDVVFDASDSNLYRSLAASIVHSGRYAASGTSTAFVTPGYPLFLAAIYTVSRSTLFISLVQSLVGAATVGLVAATAHRLAGKRAALSAGLIAAVFPHMIFWTGYVLTETLYVFFIVAALYFTSRAVSEEEDIRWVLGAGVTFGAAALVRPTILLFPVLLVGVAAASSRFRSTALIGFIIFSATITPWIIRNRLTMHAIIVTSTESGYVLWQGNSPGANGGSRGYVDARDFTPLKLPPGTSEVDADRIYRRAALEWMDEHPGTVTSLAPKKLWNMWRPTYAGASRFNTLVNLATYPPVVILGLVGAVVTRRQALGVVLALFLGYHLVAHGLVTGMIRFRVPVEAVLCILAGVAIDHILILRRSAAE